MTPTLLRRAAAWLTLALLLNLALPALDHHALERDPGHNHAAAAEHPAAPLHRHAFEFPHDHPETAAMEPASHAATAGGAALLVLVEPHDDGATGAASGGGANLSTGPHFALGAHSLQVQPSFSRLLRGLALRVGAPPPEMPLI